MDDYSIALSASAAKELNALEESLFDRIDAMIEGLRKDPRPPGCKKLKGHKGLWRVRVGDYRIVYGVDDPLRSITILRVAHRSNAYKI